MLKATCIEWETDGADVPLPSEVELPEELFSDGTPDSGEVADYLSDLTGYFVARYVLETEELEK